MQSHTGPYAVHFGRVDDWPAENAHFLVDRNVAALHPRTLAPALASGRAILIDANEQAKSLAALEPYVHALLAQKLRRDHLLVAIGGGVIQDITSFLAATVLRGVPWSFYPTTLLAQADSCIGSKSSINVGDKKNILGTFTPPRQVFVDHRFLATLNDQDLRSGIGEILKVSAIKGPDSFDWIAARYDEILDGRPFRSEAIRFALSVKREIIEADEFDTGIRRVMNYGHSFGHAIEAATDYAVPHGIAVTIGMDMANYLATALGLCPQRDFERMHGVLQRNYRGFEDIAIASDRVLKGLRSDKKNVGDLLTLIMPNRDGRIEPVSMAASDEFIKKAAEYLESGRRH